jgi:DNA-binding transcriptional MerR regulator
MNKQKLESIKRHLGKADVKHRIYQDMLRWRSEFVVTISHAADLFGFSENQLRDWEDRGLLSPQRSGRHRHYAFTDLDKLAIIRELLNANYAPGDIPSNMDEILDIDEMRTTLTHLSVSKPQNLTTEDNLTELPVELRIEAVGKRAFWRFFASYALHISLMLMRETLPGVTFGLVLPLYTHFGNEDGGTMEELSKVGASLIGWLNKNGSSHTLFTTNPSFRYSTDYYFLPLGKMKNEKVLELPQDRTLIILERQDKRSRYLSLSEPVVKLIQRLLAPLYEEGQMIQACFDTKIYDEAISVSDVSSSTDYQDNILEGLSDMIIHMGGRTTNSQNRWRFCHILLPESSVDSLPVLQRSLVTRAQSKDSPYVIGASVFSPQKSMTSIAIRAFQSGRVIYRPELSMRDRVQALIDVEGSIHSNIAIPIGGENGPPVAVLYVASDELSAFSREDQQLLRIIGRFIENILNIYHARLQVTAKLRDLMSRPEVVDNLFVEFLSENDFRRDVELLLMHLKEEDEKHEKEKSVLGTHEEVFHHVVDAVSFIALGIDDVESLASRYGDQIIKHLNKRIGLRLQELVASLITWSTNCQLYYIYADRFYLVLRDISLEKTREKAEEIRKSLEGNLSIKQSDIANTVLILPDITVHLAVTSYKYNKLSEFLQVYASIADISAKISQELDAMLKMGMDEGGNVVMTWGDVSGGFSRWSPR